MKFDAATRSIRLDRKNCGNCRYSGTPGTRLGRIDCPKCGGTGDGPRGGRRGCRECHGFGNKVDRDLSPTIACERCSGNWQDAEAESWTDSLETETYLEIVDTVGIKIYTKSFQSWNEMHLGFGCLVSCTDYGRWRQADDPKQHLQDAVREQSHVQACKVARETDDDTVLEVCDHIAVIANTQGYSIRAVFDFDETQAEVMSELTYDEVHGGTGFYA